MGKSDGDLSSDIIIEILSRLSVKSLTRFKCVCKTWNALFKSTRFISKHLKNDNDARLLVNYIFVEDEFSYPIDVHYLFPDETLADLSIEDFTFPQPYGIVGGPYDGIFCMHGNGTLNLLNLATKEIRALPKFRALPHYTSTLCNNFGFGLDIRINDYKFVNIITLWDRKKNTLYEFSHVAVYNLSTSTWRDTECFKSSHYYMHLSSDCTYLDGVCYWLSNFATSHKVILSFHLSDEIFMEIQVPSGPSAQESEHVTLGLYKNSLSLLCLDEKEDCFYIWVMTEKCFTKILTAGPFSGVKKPLGFWKKGAIFLHSNTEQLLLYDPTDTQELRDLGVKDFWLSVDTYKESLITVKGDDALLGFLKFHGIYWE